MVCRSLLSELCVLLSLKQRVACLLGDALRWAILSYASVRNRNLRVHRGTSCHFRLAPLGYRDSARYAFEPATPPFMTLMSGDHSVTCETRIAAVRPSLNDHASDSDRERSSAYD